MKFNEKLVKLRKENLLSQEELAEKLGVTRQTISKWELEQTTPDMDKLSQMAKLFNVSVDELLNETDEPTKTNKVSDKNNNKKNTAIVIILIIVLIVVLGGVGISIFNKPAKSVENGKENFGIIERIVDSFMNIFSNTADKMMEKGEEIKNKNDQELKERQKEMREEMQNWYDEQTNKMNEEYEKKKNEVYDSYNKSVQETNERYQQQYEQQKNQILNNAGF